MFLFDVDPETKYIFMVFRVDESFWTQKQSCITQKVGLEKWCLFFDFVCFSGRHFTLPHFAKKDIGKNFFLKFLHFHLTFLHHISKIWGCVLQFWFILILAICGIHTMISSSKMKIDQNCKKHPQILIHGAKC